VEPKQFIASILALAIFSLSACGDRYVVSAVADAPQVELLPIQIDKRNPERVDFDRLWLLGAFQLRSRDQRFGGLSGLAIGADHKLYAVSDRGFWLSGRMHLSASRQLVNVTDWQIAPLLTTKGKPVDNRSLADAEALAQASDGSFLVAFEHTHRIWRYRAPPHTFSSPATPVPIPSEIMKAPRNGGMEALSILPDGRIFVIAEELKNPDETVKAWLIDGDNSAQLSYYPATGFAVSDSTALSSGDVIVLERRFQFPGSFAARLTMIRGEQIRPGAVLKGEELVRLEAPLSTDNFEGVTAIQSDTDTMIFLVSDDNYFTLQRTLLFQFLLPNSGSAKDR
jgi:hypothetical protein